MTQKYRLAYIVSHPIQYQAPLLKKIAESGLIDLTVYYCHKGSAEKACYDPEFGISFKWDTSLLEGYRYKFLMNISPLPRHLPAGLINVEIVNELCKRRYDAIWVHGYSYITAWLAFLTAQLTGTPILLRGESSLLNRTNCFNRVLRRAAVGMASCVLPIGKCNSDFYRYFGVRHDRMFPMPYAVDNQFFQKERQAIFYKKKELKEGFGIPESHPVVLYAGKLVSRKRPMDLLEAYEGAVRKIPAALVFVGEGVERKDLEAYCKTHNIPFVCFANFKNQREIARYYAMADIFVLPSAYEPWGLVINEAMNFGLPIIATDMAASGFDLVRSGENGFIYPVGDIEQLTNYIRVLVTEPQLREEMGKRSLKMILKWSYSEDVDGLTDALKSTTTIK